MARLGHSIRGLDSYLCPVDCVAARLPLFTKPLRFGGRAGTRTQNPLIKSQLLCQLSYAPDWQNHGDSVRGVKRAAASVP